MTLDQFKVYARHPIQYLRSRATMVKQWWDVRKGRARVRKFMAELREMEINLREASDPCCSRCWGRGHRGFNITTKQWVICSCTYNPRTAEKCEAKPWLRS